jgi:putative acetyltransferase
VTDIRVRAERGSDMQAIDVVNVSAFEGDAEAQLVSDLRNTSDYIPELSLVAEYKNRLVGHIMLTKANLLRTDQRVDMLVLGPMSVVPSQAQRGIGGILLKQALAKAKQMGFSAIAEIGQTEYYLRYGFRPITDFALTHNLNEGDGNITALELEHGALAGGGELVFPEPFKQIFDTAV